MRRVLIRWRLNEMSELREMIKRHEGFRLELYKCSAGKLTIGYGRNLTDVGITEGEAEQLLSNDIVNAQIDFCRIFDFSVAKIGPIPSAAYDALVDMMFNLGFSRFMKFKKMIAAIEAENWSLAADEMLDSKWAKQVGSRAIELAEMVRSG